jgi:hypothetical protein
MTRFVQFATAAGAALCAACATTSTYGPWGPAQPVAEINSPAAEGCPIESPDALAFYFASTRNASGAKGKQDIYRSRRAAIGSAWGPAENLGAPINTAEFEYCPTPTAGGTLYYVTSMPMAGSCHGDTPPAAPPGGPAPGDIVRAQEDPVRGWLPPLQLGCYPKGPNTAGAEFSPSLIHTAEGAFLFFSSNGYPDSQGQDIYMSRVLNDGTVQPGVRVAELSGAADDRMPSVREDGLEIVFSSNRAGSTPFDQDIYVATRPSTSAPWSAPQRIDNHSINTPGSETRASLSGDGKRLYFGRKTKIDDPGDIFVSTRTTR